MQERSVSALFTPVQMGALTLRNRIVMAPLKRVCVRVILTTCRPLCSLSITRNAPQLA